MYAEIEQAAALNAPRHRPGLAALREARPERAMEILCSSLRAAGWMPAGRGLCLAGQTDGDGVAISLRLRGWTGSGEQALRAVALVSGLSLLAEAHIPLCKRIDLGLGEGGDQAGRGPDLVLNPAWDPAPFRDGWIILPGPESPGGVIPLPEPAFLAGARKALQNAGFRPRTCLFSGADWTGFGFALPGRPDESQGWMARAIQAVASLAYGMAGYGVMAFPFDLEF
ncbi:MAG: hypothetical protein ACM3X6_10220 [Patescibacteria group bacterium]